MDDVPGGEGHLLFVEVLPIRFQDAPCGTVSHGHGGELYEGLVCLLWAYTLPSGGRVLDIQRIVVAETAWLSVVHIV